MVFWRRDAGALLTPPQQRAPYNMLSGRPPSSSTQESRTGLRRSSALQSSAKWLFQRDIQNISAGFNCLLAIFNSLNLQQPSTVQSSAVASNPLHSSIVFTASQPFTHSGLRPLLLSICLLLPGVDALAIEQIGASCSLCYRLVGFLHRINNNVPKSAFKTHRHG